MGITARETVETVIEVRLVFGPLFAGGRCLGPDHQLR